MSAQTLEGAMGDNKGASYIEHLKEHRKKIMLAFDRVKKRAKSHKGCAKRLAEYDATLERYARELAVWEILHPETEG